MNRREFVKSLGVVAAASFVPIAYAAKSKPELDYLTCGRDGDQISKMLDMIKNVDLQLVKNGFKHLGYIEIDSMYEANRVPNDGGGYRSTLKYGPVKFEVTGTGSSIYSVENLYHLCSNPEDVAAYLGNDSSLKLVHYIKEFDIICSPTPMVVSKFSGLRISKLPVYWETVMTLEDKYIFDMYTIG